MSDFDIILDSSQQNLKEVPPKLLQMRNLKMLYLHQNFIKELPKTFFQKLPQLSWLDLRNNHLTTIPKGIAHHQHLENLLLTDNKIEALPNELGLVPNLKVLQITNNPLTYPNARVVTEGTKSVCAYLRHQYEKVAHPPSETDLNLAHLTDEEKEVVAEEEIRVMADYSDYPMQQPLDSSLVVRGLSKIKREGSEIVHKLSTSADKMLLKSYYDEDKYVRASTQTSDSIGYLPSPYKQSWIDKLKHLLDEQEKILQQERNLQALTSWRAEKKTEAVRPVHRDEYWAEPPYATDPQYDTILSREDMKKEIDKMIVHSRHPPKSEQLEKLIDDLVGQLKNMEGTYGDLQSPRSEIEAAGNQIMKIMEVHKNLVRLRNVNNSSFQ